MLALLLSGFGAIAALVALLAPKLHDRWQLSRAKHRSLHGHARWSQRLARWVPQYEYDEPRIFACEGAPPAVAARRKQGFDALASELARRSPRTLAASAELAAGISDLQFTRRYRVPFQFSRYVRERLPVGAVLERSAGPMVEDLDRTGYYDLSGSYGVNLFGYDFYKACIEEGADQVKALGPVLGAYHPVIAENVRRLRDISRHDEVSFHMSGTEAVMQAVRLARYHTGRSHLVRFSGAYHGWWDGVQPGVGNPRPVDETYTLKEMDAATLRVLRNRSDVACVLVNPLQALHPNAAAPTDGTLLTSGRRAGFDRDRYSAWLRELREVCTDRGIALIFDEVFVGFRLARGGAQEYFGVGADLVTYGKTLGGGLPIGVVCGQARWMRRFVDERPSDICFARGTFNSHPYVMAAMHQFLTRLDQSPWRETYAGLDERWNQRAAELNRRLEAEDLPVRVANLVSIWTVLYTRPSRYNWMFQYYLRAHHLWLSWVGTGRLIFSHEWSDQDFAAVADRFVAAARQMHADAWWWAPAELSNRAITRQVVREMLLARFRRPAAAA